MKLKLATLVILPLVGLSLSACAPTAVDNVAATPTTTPTVETEGFTCETLDDGNISCSTRAKDAEGSSYMMQLVCTPETKSIGHVIWGLSYSGDNVTFSSELARVSFDSMPAMDFGAATWQDDIAYRFEMGNPSDKNAASVSLVKQFFGHSVMHWQFADAASVVHDVQFSVAHAPRIVDDFKPAGCQIL